MRFLFIYIFLGLCCFTNVNAQTATKAGPSDPPSTKQHFSTAAATVAVDSTLFSKSIQAPYDTTIFTKFIIVPLQPNDPINKQKEKNNTKAIEPKK